MLRGKLKYQVRERERERERKGPGGAYFFYTTVKPFSRKNSKKCSGERV